MPDQTIVISDIYMSDPSAGYSWFKDNYPQYLSSFLHTVATNSSVKELVLLGDLFDFWLYPVRTVPLSVSAIIEKNPLIIQGLKECVERLPAVYYIVGNHDQGVRQEDLGIF